MDCGTTRLGERGYTGRKDPVKGKLGKGLKEPVSGLHLDTISHEMTGGASHHWLYALSYGLPDCESVSRL